MDRDEFMELVYETFADEPDNVLANGIIEAADAYAEHEKAQLFQQGTTSDMIRRQDALDIFDDYNVSVENGELEAYRRDRERLLALPTIQPEPSACEYCHEDSDGYVTPIEKNGHAFIRFGMDGWELSLHAKGWHGSAKIKCCPICGRRLTHE